MVADVSITSFRLVTHTISSWFSGQGSGNITEFCANLTEFIAQHQQPSGSAGQCPQQLTFAVELFSILCANDTNPGLRTPPPIKKVYLDDSRPDMPSLSSLRSLATPMASAIPY